MVLLTGALLDSVLMPINKNLWTSSYTVFMAGWAMAWLGLFYWLIDVKGWQRWATPFVIYGMNAIVLEGDGQMLRVGQRVSGRWR